MLRCCWMVQTQTYCYKDETMKRIDLKMVTIVATTLFSLAAPPFSFSSAVAKTFTVNYTKATDITPKAFTVKTGEKVRLEVNASETGSGCMSSIMVPGLWNQAQPLVKGKKIVMEFTPQKPGVYKITCAMGLSRGVINVR